MLTKPLHTNILRACLTGLYITVSLFNLSCSGKIDTHFDDNFQEQWWSYYERGRYFSQANRYKEAISDFKKAIEELENDTWRVQTGNAGTIDYFPHRELGVVYYLRQEYNLAIPELEHSIKTAPSAKGHYFFNKARAAQINRNSSDKSPPQLIIRGPQGKRLTNSTSMTIDGVAIDDTFVSSIQIGKEQIPFEIAKKQKKFSVAIPLDSGENIIPIAVTDLAGNTTRDTLAIFCDRNGPLVEIRKNEKKDGRIIVRGVVSDEGGLHSLTINDTPWKITGEYPAYNFAFDITEGKIELVATDRAGNITRVDLDQERLDHDQLLGPPVEVLNSDSFPIDNGIFSQNPSGRDDSLPVPLEESEPPVIALQNDIVRDSVTYDDRILLHGMVTDLSLIRSFSINDVPVSIMGGRKLYFNQLEKLVEGSNEISIAALDVNGNETVKKITVQRKIQNIQKIDTRMSIAVLPFVYKGEDPSDNDRIHHRIIDSFLELQRFNMIEPHMIDAALQGRIMSETLLSEPDKIKELGKLLETDALLAGTIIEDQGTIEIIGWLIDTKTPTILARNDVFGDTGSITSKDALLNNLALKFKHDFPIIEGIVTNILDNGEVVIDIGSEKRLKPNRSFICYRKGLEIRHPVTGEILGAEPEIISEMTVTEVMRQASRATLHNQKAPVRLYDRVIAR